MAAVEHRMPVAEHHKLAVEHRKPVVADYTPVAEHRKVAVAFLDIGPAEVATRKALVPVGDHMQVVENRMPLLNTEIWTDFLLLILIMTVIY